MSRADDHEADDANGHSLVTLLPEISLALSTCQSGRQKPAKSPNPLSGSKFFVTAALTEHSTGRFGQLRQTLTLRRLDRTTADGDHPRVNRFSSVITTPSSTWHRSCAPGAHPAARMLHDWLATCSGNESPNWSPSLLDIPEKDKVFIASLPLLWRAMPSTAVPPK
jgi:hypothetical protein